MSKVNIIRGENVEILVSGVSNTTIIRVITPTYDVMGEKDGGQVQNITLDTYGEELKDLISAIKQLEKEI